MINKKFTRNATEEYKQARREEKRLHKSKKKQHRENLLKEVERLKSSNESRAFYRAVNKERKDFKPKIRLCKDKNGVIINEKEKIIERWVEHFDQLLNTGALTPSQVITDATGGEYKEEDLIETPTIDEVQDIIDKLKNHKAAGPDQISPELIKYGGKMLTRVIYEILLLIWKSETLPKEWNLGILCPIHKKGDTLNCENYRGISLLCIAYKVFSNILFKLLSPIVDNQIGDYQCGFRKGRSTVDQIFTLRQILEKCREYGVETHH